MSEQRSIQGREVAPPPWICSRPIAEPFEDEWPKPALSNRSVLEHSARPRTKAATTDCRQPNHGLLQLFGSTSFSGG
jgi:hypothetical protein